MLASTEYALLVRIPWRDAHEREDEPAGIRLRVACRCGHMGGLVRRTGGQYVVRCAGCGRYQYCAPRREVATW